VREDHAAYIATWITVLKADARAIFSAAAHAQRAAVYLHNGAPLPSFRRRANRRHMARDSMHKPKAEKRVHYMRFSLIAP
jgi:antirestriction protein ArdC